MSEMNPYILLWNLNGFHSSFNDLDILISRKNPKIICLNETHHDHQNSAIQFPGFVIYEKPGGKDNSNRNIGGVAILIDENLPHKEVHIQSNLQLVAIETCLPTKVTIITRNIRRLERTQHQLGLSFQQCKRRAYSKSDDYTQSHADQ